MTQLEKARSTPLPTREEFNRVMNYIGREVVEHAIRKHGLREEEVEENDPKRQAELAEQCGVVKAWVGFQPLAHTAADGLMVREFLAAIGVDPASNPPSEQPTRKPVVMPLAREGEA